MTKHEWLAVSSALVLITASGCGGGGGESGSADHPAPSSQPAGTGGAAASGEFGTASITGTVTYAGATPAASAVKMDADPYCSLQHPDGVMKSNYVVGAGGGLQWAFVYVKEGVSGSYGAPGGGVVLDQKGCEYDPHVFGIMPGQELLIKNSDETLHNIHSLANASRQFNLAMPRVGMELKQSFKAPEIMVRIKCDVHPWMECFAGVVPHPFHAVSRDDGSFTIDRLPAGTYTLEAWHEAGGTQTQTVTVGEGESKQITFSFQA